MMVAQFKSRLEESEGKRKGWNGIFLIIIRANSSKVGPISISVIFKQSNPPSRVFLKHNKDSYLFILFLFYFVLKLVWIFKH